MIVAYATDHGIRVVDPLREFVERAGGQPRFRFGGDRHWSPAAHAIAAELVAEFLIRERLVEAATAPNDGA